MMFRQLFTRGRRAPLYPHASPHGRIQPIDPAEQAALDFLREQRAARQARAARGDRS